MARFRIRPDPKANDEHVAILKQCVAARNMAPWNEWRDKKPRHPPGAQRDGPARG
jgi:hypothetical protein